MPARRWSAVTEAGDETLLDELRAAGLRATRSRVTVLRYVREAARPVSLADAVDHLGNAGADRATVYRNLLDLTEAGFLRRAHLGEAWRFEGIGADPGHPHFVCTRCGTVACAPEVALQVDVESDRPSPHALKLGQFEVQLHGTCDDCT